MGFAKDDAEEILVVVVLAVVFAWMFAIVLNFYVLGVLSTVLVIVAAFIFQLVRFLIRNKTDGKTPRP